MRLDCTIHPKADHWGNNGRLFFIWQKSASEMRLQSANAFSLLFFLKYEDKNGMSLNCFFPA